MTKGKFAILFIIIILLITGIILIKKGILRYNVGLEYISKDGKSYCICIKGPESNANKIISFNKQKELEKGKETVDKREYYQGIKPLSIAAKKSTDKEKYYYRFTAMNNKIKTITYLKIAFIDEKSNELGELGIIVKLVNSEFVNKDIPVAKSKFIEKFHDIKIKELKLETGEHFIYEINTDK